MRAWSPPGPFDLDHIGPHVGEQPSSELSPVGAQVENAQSRQGSGIAHLAGFRRALSRMSMANGLRSRVGGISSMTSFFGPVRLPPRIRMV